MAHEVIKRVGDRAYRYSVESYRDPGSGKVRSRWTYLGKAVPADAGAAPLRTAEAPARRSSPEATREKLIEALERLLEEGDLSSVSVSAVAAAAGVAHGTFYRHFRDRDDALLATFTRVREDRERAGPSFAGPLGSLEYERRRVREWVEAKLQVTIARPGVIRAMYAVAADIAQFRAGRAERRRDMVSVVAGYIDRLRSAGLTQAADSVPTATALFTLLEGVVRRVALEREPLDEATVAGVATVFDRSIFVDRDATSSG